MSNLSTALQSLKDIRDYENAGEIGFQKFCDSFYKVVREEFSDIPDEIWNMGFSKEWSLSGIVLREQERQRNEFMKSLAPFRQALYDIFLYGEDVYVTFNLTGKKKTGVLMNERSKSVEVELIKFSPGINRKRETRTGVIIKRHKKKHQVRVYPFGIRPIN